MAVPGEQDEAQARAESDGRVAFGLSAFIFAAVLLILLDRVGAPERLVASLGPLAGLCALALIGVALRSLRISRFYAAGRRAPSNAAGLAFAALAAGLYAPFVPPEATAVSAADVGTGLLLGCALAAFATGPLVRKTGAFSLVELLGARFPDLALRLGVIAVVSVASYFIAAASLETGVRGLQTALLIGRREAVTLACAAVLLIALPAGLAGVVWSSFAAGCALLLGLALPIGFLVVQGRAGAWPSSSDSAWSHAAARLSSWGGVASSGLHPLAILAVTAGVGVLAPLLAPAIATAHRRSAHAAGRSGLLWLVAFAVLLGLTLHWSASFFDVSLVGLRPDQLPSFAYQSSARNLIRICGQAVDSPAAALAACQASPGFTGVLRAADLTARGAFLATSLPVLTGAGEAYAGLCAAGAICSSLALAAAAFLALATAIGHDAVYRLAARRALTSRRLAIMRGLLLGAVVVTGSILVDQSVNAQEMIGLATAFSAAAIAPLLALTFWPRATGADALFALLCGLAAAEAFIVAGGAPPSFERLSTGAAIACFVAVTVGFVSSLLRAPDPLRGGGIFFDRVVHGYGDVLNPDKGA